MRSRSRRLDFRLPATSLLCFTLLILLVLSPARVEAQTIGQPVSNQAFGNPGQGQSFTATVTGTVTQIGVRPNNSVINDTLRIYNGNAGSGTAFSIGTPIYSQTVSSVASGDGDPLTVYVLTTPLPVVAGNTYSFVFDATQLRFGGGYPGGDYIFNNTVTFLGADAAFLVTQQAAPSAVPTMSEWAMIFFSLILAGGAALYIQRRQLKA